MTTPIDILSTSVVPMLDAAWVRDNRLDATSRRVISLLRKLREHEREIEEIRVAREKTQDDLREALAEIRAKREEDEADNG